MEAEPRRSYWIWGHRDDQVVLATAFSLPESQAADGTARVEAFACDVHDSYDCMAVLVVPPSGDWRWFQIHTSIVAELVRP